MGSVIAGLSRPAVSYAGVAELADAPDLGSGGRPCRFKSCHPHLYIERCSWKSTILGANCIAREE